VVQQLKFGLHDLHISEHLGRRTFPGSLMQNSSTSNKY